MKLPLQVTFRDIEPTDSIKQYIEKRAARLDRFDPQIMRCRVVIEAPHRRRHSGRHYRVHVAVTVPHAELVVDHDTPQHRSFEDLYAAIDEVFDEMRRKVEDAVHVRRQRVKSHEPHAAAGRVVKLFRRSGYGFLERGDGQQIYFHRNAVKHAAFSQLAVGDPVRFVEEPGEEGPQATAVFARQSAVAAAP